ncbi:MAG TPA: chromosome segregation protein SMC [Mycobacteriales bacterium]
MHLKTLTVKGFKSFAGSTTFRFEPGMTCVVGPNGSGKSNVVDAIAWVLGEQGAKALRGGQMSDVIFAGTPDRPALGRAEVTLTIDNSDGALPVEFTEVSISRLLYRSGESEYAINGTPCRLLDVQELMSDSGIGRELHVIVGQGQLDAVLQARPEDRRAYVEEAAGVLKHRKRKEKALRKVEATATNIARLTDLTGELRRQLGPLGRQAEIARRAGAIQAALRDARLRLLADDLTVLREALAEELADQRSALARRDAVEQELAQVRLREASLEADVAAAAPQAAGAQDLYFRLSSTVERLRGLQALAAERARHLADPVERRTGRDPDETDAEARDARAAEAQTAAALAADRDALEAVVIRRQEAESALASAEQALASAARAAADRREGIARLAGEASALAGRIEAADGALARLRDRAQQAHAAAEAAAQARAAVEADAGALDAGEQGLDQRHERAIAAARHADGEVEALQEAVRTAERDRASWAARADALALTAPGPDGAGLLLARDDVLGAVASLLVVRPGAEAAVAAALGAWADAVVVGGLAAAGRALASLKAEDGGRAGLVVTGGEEPLPDRAAPAGHWAVELVEGRADLLGPVRRALAGVVVVDDVDEAVRVVERDPRLRAVTRAGDLIGADWVSGGSASAPSQIEVSASLDEARVRTADAEARLDAAEAALADARGRQAGAAAEVEAALAALHESDARMAATADELGRLAAAASAAAADAEHLEQQEAEARAAYEQDVARLAELRARLADVPDESGEPAAEPDPAARDRLVEAVSAARAQEIESRLAVRTGEERVRALAGRAEQLERAAQAERDARAALTAAAERRSAGASAATRIAALAATALGVAEGSLAEAAAAREQAAAARTVGEGELLAVRADARRLAEDLDVLRDAATRDEVAHAEQRLRIESLEQRAAEEYGVDAEALLAEYGPHLSVPPDADAPDGARPTPYDREVQTRRAQQADRQLAQLGRVNPLALEEFAAMEERHAFLAGQLEDLTRTRRDLLAIVRDVDEHIEAVFRSAFEDTAREFQEVFGLLFPGGSGHLELTEPDDIMATGIDVVAKPAGKKVSRLSLLSGGERSLAAIALLVAIFRARPSPFYVLDEVEAALDDRNLQSLLRCLDGLREASQLIVITHQKRTMEVADALYGVSMRGDGISTVISQRLREREPA